MEQQYALLAALVGSLITYLVAWRRLSGRIDTTEAAELWKEGAAMRVDLQGQLDKALDRVTRLEARAATAEAQNNALQARNIELDRQAFGYQQTIEAQRVEIDELKADRDDLRKEVHDLHDLVKALQEAA